jgi:hypothetical protein
MGKYVNRITYKDREILFMDIANMGAEAVLAAWEEGGQELSKERGVCLALVDATNTPVSVAIVNKAREAAGKLKGNPGNRAAFIGMTGLLKSTAQLHVRAMGVHAHFCATVEEGREWLIQEDEKRRKGQSA